MRERGFLMGVQLYVALAALAVVLGLGAAAAYYRNSARAAEAEATLARDQRDQYRANYEASEKARAVEQKRAEIFEEVALELEKEKRELKDQNRRDIDAVRAGELRLRVRGACPANPAPETDPASGQRDDPTTGELPREITEDLLGLANDADEVVKQLSACQSAIRTYIAQ